MGEAPENSLKFKSFLKIGKKIEKTIQNLLGGGKKEFEKKKKKEKKN